MRESLEVLAAELCCHRVGRDLQGVRYPGAFFHHAFAARESSWHRVDQWLGLLQSWGLLRGYTFQGAAKRVRPR